MPADSHTRPFLPHMERVRHEFERWLEAAWSQGGRAMDVFGLRGRNHQPDIDMIEHADSLEVAFDLPGVDCSQIELTVSGHSLSLSGDFPKTEVPAGSRMQLTERPEGSFSRVIMLPPGLDPESIKAVGKNGVIRVTIQKLEQEKPRRVVVQSDPSETRTT